MDGLLDAPEELERTTNNCWYYRDNVDIIDLTSEIRFKLKGESERTPGCVDEVIEAKYRDYY